MIVRLLAIATIPTMVPIFFIGAPLLQTRRLLLLFVIFIVLASAGILNLCRVACLVVL